MKLLSAGFLIILFFTFSFAQNESRREQPALAVIKFKWSNDLHNPELERDPNAEANDALSGDLRRKNAQQTNETLRAAGMPARDLPEPELRSDLPKREATARYLYEITVQNISGKDVSGFTWEYVFLSSGKEVGRRRFESKERIATGKMRKLAVRSAIPPTGTIDVSKSAKKSPEKYTEQIVIVHVDYSDGTKWPG